MKQTAMQNLKGDLILTIDSAKEAFLEIENVAIRKACQEVVRLTLKKIIERIDDELLEIEKQQIIDSWIDGDARICQTKSIQHAEQYYNKTFKQQ